MFTDMVGYTALTQTNESQAMQVLQRHNQLLRPYFPRYNGREVKAIGDSFLVEFASALDAAKCAIEIQTFLHDYNASSKDEWKIKLRIGIHLGDVVHQGGDVFGDAVNIASRIEPIAGSEGICISEQVYDQVGNKLALPLVKLAPKALKNVKVPIDVYKVVMPWESEVAVPAEELDVRRIAVLPFTNMSPDPNDEYFADGMTEELISSLSGIKELTVIARTSVMKYKTGTKGVDEIGRELHAGTLVEGSVRKAGNRIRVTVQVVNSSTEGHLWSQNYDRTLDDVFVVQSDIAQKVADSMKVKLVATERANIARAPTQSMPAYERYLRGMTIVNKGDVSASSDAIRHFEEAIKLDPGFSVAYAELGNLYVALAGETIAPREAFAKAEPLVAKALELDETSSDAHLAKGNLALQYHLDYATAEREFRRSIELNPSNMLAHLWFANYHVIVTGDYDEGLQEAETARGLDPLSMRPRYIVDNCYFLKGDYETCIANAKEEVALEPDKVSTHLFLTLCYFLAGMRELAEKELETSLGLKIGRYERDFVAWHLAVQGKQDKAREVLREIEADKEKGYHSPTFMAGVYAALGEKDKAFALLEQDFTDSPTTFLFRFRFPQANPLRDDPRFVTLVKKLNLPATSKLPE
jgi:adenylate cyclase